MTTKLDWQGGGDGLRTDAGELGVWTIEPWHGRHILKHSSERHLWNGGGCIHDTIELAKAYAQNIVNDHENPVKPRGPYTLDDFAKILAGEHFLPNVQELELKHGLDDIAARGHMFTPKWGYSRGPEGRKAWTQYFLDVSDGSGTAIIYGRGIVSFAICRHQKKTHAGANHSRGWHPGHCIKCGLDLTVDSSD